MEQAAVDQFKHLRKRGLSVEEAKRWLKSNWMEYLDKDDLDRIARKAYDKVGLLS